MLGCPQAAHPVHLVLQCHTVSHNWKRPSLRFLQSLLTHRSEHNKRLPNSSSRSLGSFTSGPCSWWGLEWASSEGSWLLTSKLAYNSLQGYVDIDIFQNSHQCAGYPQHLHLRDGLTKSFQICVCWPARRSSGLTAG